MAVAAIMVLGAGLRIYQYLWDRSLWVDEAALANNVINRSFLELTGPLDHHQVAPVGFLFIERLAVLILGPSEHSLRLPPLVFALAALVLFWAVARRTLSPLGAVVAMGLFAVSPRVIYYGAEVKQYSSDVAIGLGSMLGVLWIAKRGLTVRRALFFGAAGAVALWFSQTVVFYLAAAGLTLLVQYLPKLRQSVVPMALMMGPWVGSFVLAHGAARRNVLNASHMADWWAEGFLPLPPTNAAEVFTWTGAFVYMFRDPLGFTVPSIALLGFIIGGVHYCRRREIPLLLLLAAPIALTMLASGLGVYPFGGATAAAGRVLLFLVPPAILLVGQGVAVLAARFEVSGITVGVALAAVFLIVRLEPSVLKDFTRHSRDRSAWAYVADLPPFKTTPEQLVPVPVGSVIRKLHAERHGEPIYIYATAVPTAQYYADRLGIDREDLILGSELGYDADAVRGELDPLRKYDRAWVFFAYHWGFAHAPFLRYLDSIATRRATVHDGILAGAVLYDFTAGPQPAAIGNSQLQEN